VARFCPRRCLWSKARGTNHLTSSTKYRCKNSRQYTAYGLLLTNVIASTDMHIIAVPSEVVEGGHLLVTCLKLPPWNVQLGL
jgi:hypothetical protein